MTRKASPVGPGGKRYQQVAHSLIEEIRSGRLSVGDSLPGELEMVESFGVSRHTIREALRRIEDLGLIGRRQGVGTIVLSREPVQSYVQAVRSPAELLQYPAGSRLFVESVEPVKAGRGLAQLIGCRAGMHWLQVSCLRRFEDGRPPVCWSDVFLLPEHEGVVARIGREPGLVHELIERICGRQVAAVDVAIMARAVPARISQALGVAAGTPSLTAVRRYTDRDGALFLAAVSEHPGDRFTYTMSLERGWQSGGGAVWGSR